MHRYCISRWIGWTWEWMGGEMQGKKAVKTGSRVSRLEQLFSEMGKVQQRLLVEQMYRRQFFFLVMLSVWYWLGIRVETVIRQLAEHTSLKSRKRVWIGGIYLWFIGNRNICSPHPLPPKNNDWVWKRKFPKTEHWAFQCLEVLIRRT